jgi:glucose-1-phosphate thymidylyltransferase
LNAHKSLIVEQKTTFSDIKGNVFIKPVFVEKGAQIKNSIIGPNVSVGKNAKIVRSIISDSIVSDDALVENNNLETSFVGKRAKVIGSSKKVNVKDHGVARDE